MANRIPPMILGIFSLLVFSCKQTSIGKSNANFKGEIQVLKPNAMPLLGESSAKGTGLNTTILIYQPTETNQVDSLFGQFCSHIQTAFVRAVHSDDTGHFVLNLKPGKYSVFVQYEHALYIPFFSGTNWLSLIEIKPNEMTNLDINIAGNSSYQ